MSDLDYLHAAIAEAQAAEASGEVPVGAVVVHNGKIIDENCTDNYLANLRLEKIGA